MSYFPNPDQPFQIVTIGVQGPPGPQGPPGAGADFTYVTVADETEALPDSSRIVAGTNVTFDTSTPNELIINATGGSGSGTVTSVAAGTGLTASPSPIVASGTIALANTAVSPNSYTAANITVDAQGRLTAAANGNVGVTSLTAGAGLTASPNPVIGTGTIALANTTVTPNSYTSANITVDAQGRITAASNGSGGGGAPTTDTYITAADETGTLPNSIQIFSKVGSNSINIDPTQTSTTTQTNNIAIGTGCVSNGFNASVAVGHMSQSSGNVSLAIGSLAVAASDGDTAIGESASTAGSGGNSVAIGNSATINGGSGGSIAIGQSATCTTSDTISIGQLSTCGGFLSAVVGRSAVSTGQQSVILGYTSSDDGRNNVCSIGLAGLSRDLIHVAHIEGGTAAPVITAGAGGDATATVSVTGTDLAGQISVTAAGSPSTSAVICDVTFNAAYLSAPRVVFSPANAAAGALTGIYVTSSTTDCFLHAGSVALTPSTTYLWNYIVVQ